MENYILSLIKENNRVIIPEFGAFIVAKENGISLLFNNFLSFNDGLLVDHIIAEENISKDEANAKIKEYVTLVKDTLDSVGSYTIQGLGQFSKDATGILRFEQSDELSESSMNAPVASKLDDGLLDIALDDQKEEPVVEDITPVSDHQVSTTLNESTPIAEVEEEKPAEIERPAPIEVDKIEKEEENRVEQKEEKKEAIRVANRYIEEDKKKRNRSITLFLVFFLLIPLLGFSVYLLFFKGDSPAKTISKIALEQEVKEEIKEELPEHNMSGIEAGPDSVDEVEEPVVEEQVAPVMTKPHHLIVGSFSTQENADKMIDKLQSKGYEYCFSFHHNGRYLVSLESFNKVFQAQERQEEILEAERMESWIMTKRK